MTPVHGAASGAPLLWGPIILDQQAGADEGRLLAGLSYTACRVAVDWATVEQEPGLWNEAVFRALRQRLLALRDAGIEPILTLHRGHDPLWFQTSRGWLRGDAVQLFCRYVVRVVEEVGDLVTYYVTIDRPTELALRAAQQPGARRATPWRLGLATPATWGLRRTLRAFLHAHGAARRTLRHATPRHGLRLPGPPVTIIGHHIQPFAPRRAASLTDRAAVAAADYLWNWLPLRVLSDGVFHPPLGHGNYLLELHDSLDLVGLSCGPSVVLPPATPTGADAEALPTGFGDHVALRQMLRRAAALGKPLLIVADGCPGAPDQQAAWLQARLAIIATARTGGADVRGYLYYDLPDGPFGGPDQTSACPVMAE